MKKQRSLNRVLIMAGGTGGHVFPGLALANAMRQAGVEVHWIGTAQGMESRLVTEAQFSFHPISIKGVRGKGWKHAFAAPFKIAIAIKQCVSIMQQVKPDVVVGMGGFVSGPGGIASFMLGKPLLIHEQNAKAGLTNKILAFFARTVVAGFPKAFHPQTKVHYLGNPVRAEIEQLPSPEARFLERQPPLRLLVLGGSLGAQALNLQVPEALAKLPASLRPLVMHQTGERNYTETQSAYEKHGLMDSNIRLYPFMQDMSEAYAWADIVLCRAGALTVAELCSVGLGAIFVPYPHAVDDHQTANATYMTNGGAGICIPQHHLTTEKLVEILTEYSQTPQKCFKMAQAAYKLRQADVADKIFTLCKEVCR